MTDIIQAGIEIDVTGVDRGEVALKRLAQTGEQVDKSFERGAKAAKGAGDATAQAGREADKARGSFSGFTQETKEMAAATNSLTSAAGKLGAALGSAFALNKTISTITAFEDSILRLQATSNASADAMAQLEKQARTLGATSSYSAGQAADAQNFLAMAGLKTNEILGSTASVMKFASAAGIDLARSADIATNVLGGMQLPVSQLDRVMNSMVNSAQSANTNINQLGDAFSYAAPLAVTAGISVEQLAAAVGVLGDAGIQGSRAGTGMVGVIRQLSNATPEAQKALAGYGLTMADVDIKSKGLTGVLKTLQKANMSTADAMKIFGSEAAGAALILAGGVGKVEELTRANEKAAGKLEEVSSILDSSLSKSFAAVSSAIEEFMLQTGDSGLSKTLKILSTTVAGLINNMNGMLPEFAKASGISQEFERNIRAVSVTLKVVGTAVAAYGVAVTVAAAKTQAAAALNAIYALSLREVAKDATLAAKAVTVIQKSIALLAAAMVGWEIGTYLRKEFEIVEKAGIALMSALHQWAAQIRGTFQVMGENIKFAFLNPIDAIRSAIADMVAWIAGLGPAVAGAMGFDTTDWERSITDAHSRIRGANAAEHSKTIAQIKADTKKEIATISDGYASLFAEVGKSSKETSKAIAGTIKTTKELGEEVVAADKKIAASTGTAKELAKALKELEREQEKNTKSAIDAAKALSKGNDELRNEINSIGKTKRELVTMEQQRNNVTAAALKEAAAVLDVSIAQDKELGTTKNLIALKEKERDAILEQIDLIDERNRLLGERIDTEEVYESQKKIADQWQSLSDDMGRTFTDAIIQGGANAKEAIKRMFTNMVLRPIIEPIAQGVANMFTGAISGMFGGGQGGGLGGMLGGMFGGGGGGGGSFGFGSMLQTGQSIYSAATGWGKAMFTGFSEGGFTGAMQGLGSYFGGITAKIGSWFGGGAASGAAGGVGFGIGQPLVSGGVGSASYAGGSSMFSGLASAWPLAVVMGMIQSGKLYDAGVRPDAGEMWKSTQGNILGQIGNVGATAMSGVFKGIDSILKPIFGGKIASMISGSTFHQALWGGINKKLFGGAWKTKDVGIGLGFDGGEFSGQQYEYRKKKGGLFSKGKKKTIWTAMDEEIHDALSEAMAESVSGTKGLFEALGFEIADDALSGLKTGIKQISTMGKDEEKIQEEISDWLASTNEAVAGELHKVLGTGLDLDIEGLTDFVLNLMGVNEILGVLGLNAYDSSIAGAELAETLSGLAGGLENLASASDVYYKNFFTAEEQFEHSFAAMTKALEDAELGAIGSREAYREVVEGLDLTTEAGQEMFATMMAMAGTASEYFSILEAQAAEIAAYNSQLDAMKEALSAEPVLAYTAVLEALQNDLEGMTKELEAVGLATDENIATLEQFRQHMAELATLDLFGGGQSMADALRQGLMGTWDGEAIGDYLARSISDGVYGAIAGQFANQITDILLQGIVAPMINAALTGAAVSEAVTKESITAIVAQAQAVAQVASEVMGALKESGVMDELKSALGGGFTLPKASYTMPTYRPPVTPSYSAPKVDDSWKRLLESIIKQTERAQQQIADMGRTTYEKGLAAIASTVADYQSQIAKSTASRRKQLTEELALMEQAERKLLEAQMDQRAGDILAGIALELDKIGKTDAELAIMSIEKQTQDYINSLQDVGRATAGNIAQVEAWSQAMKDAAARDAQIKAASGAFDALGRAVDSQRSVITEALELARDVAESAASAAKDLFAGVLGASDASAAQARAFISDALGTARSTGYLPDGDKLREAIDSATRGLDDAAAVSIADANWQKLVLANQLRELADLAEPQVDYAQSQLDALDAMLQNAQDQLNVLQGIDNSVLTVAEALSRFNEAVGNGQIITPESPVFTPDMPPQQTAPDNRAQAANAELVAEVIELRNYMREIQRETKRTADAVNGRGDAPMLVETV